MQQNQVIFRDESQTNRKANFFVALSKCRLSNVAACVVLLAYIHM